MESYLCQLRAYAIVFAALERSLEDATDPWLRALYGTVRGRYAQLLADLELFADLLMPDVVPAMQAALRLAHEIRQCSKERPRLLAGHLYALSGTLLGNRVHLEDVRRLLGHRGLGEAFYLGFGPATDETWHCFSALLNASDGAADEREELVRVAREEFRQLIVIHAPLYPLPPQAERRLTATSLNPEAGTHPIPQDPREIRAALSAGRRCREEFPYFEARYGPRGRRYTSSDVAWLATLAELDEAEAVRQVEWLAGLLSRLGMPRLVLERQLELLVQELSAQAPERREQYRRLTAAAEALRGSRLEFLPEPGYSRLAAELEAELREAGCPITNLAPLVLASLADEAGGIAGAARQLEEWLCGPAGLAPHLATPIRDAFRRLRHHVKGRPPC